MANSARYDLFTALQALYTADANKLGAGTVDKGVRDFLIEGVDLANRVPPYLFVELTEQSDNTIGTDSRTINVSMHLFTEPDRSVVEQETIADQIRVKFDNITLTGTDWVWSPALFMGVDYASDIGGTPTVRHLVVRFKVLGTLGSGNKPLFGRSASITFTKGTGGESITVADIEYFETDAGVDLETYRILGDEWNAHGPAESSASFQLVQTVRAGTASDPTIPLGIMGTLKVAKNAGAASAGYITGSAMLSRRRHVGNVAGWQTYRYNGRWSGEWTEVL